MPNAQQIIQTIFMPAIVPLQDLCYSIAGQLMGFCYAFALAGMLITVYKTMVGGDLSGLWSQLMWTAVVAMTMPFFPGWVMASETVLGWNMLDSLGLGDPTIAVAGVMADIVATISLASILGNMALGFLDFGISFITGIISLIIGVILLVMAALIWIGFVIGIFIQIASLYLGLAALPIFQGMLLFPQTRETGIKYVMGLFAILMWPLGWALGMNLVVLLEGCWDALKVTMAPLTMIDLLCGGFVSLFADFVWICCMYQVLKNGPKLAQKAILTGSQLGSGIVSSAVAGATGAVSTAVSAAGAVASTAISAGGMAAAPFTGGASMAVGGAASKGISGAASMMPKGGGDK